MPLADDGAVLRIGDASVAALDEAVLGSDAEGHARPAHVRDRQAAGALPDTVSIAYFEPTRDYQAGLQRARRDGIGWREDRIELAAALSADAAKGLAEAGLARAWRERDQASARLPWRLLGVRAGMLATLGDGSLWRVHRWTLENMALELRLTRAGPPAALAAGADAGRATTGLDAPAGATRIALLDLPAPGDGATTPRIWLAAAGTGAGWRRATASQSIDGGASWQVVGQTALPAVMGTAIDALGPGPSTLFDRRGQRRDRIAPFRHGAGGHGRCGAGRRRQHGLAGRRDHPVRQCRADRRPPLAARPIGARATRQRIGHCRPCGGGKVHPARCAAAAHARRAAGGDRLDAVGNGGRPRGTTACPRPPRSK